MRKIISYLLIFIVFFSVSVLSGVPVSLILDKAPRVNGLDIQGAEGTVWKGQASNVSWQYQNFGEISWDFQFMKLFQGKAEYALRFGRGSDLDMRGRGFAGYGLLDGEIYAENVVASMPTASVISRAPLAVPISMDGHIELNLSRMTYVGPWCGQAEGVVVVNSTGIQSPLGSLDVGPVIADLRCQNSIISISGDQKTNQVESEFSVELTPERTYSTQAWFKPGSEFPSSLAAQLQWLGDPNSEGQYEFNYQSYF